MPPPVDGAVLRALGSGEGAVYQGRAGRVRKTGLLISEASSRRPVLVTLRNLAQPELIARLCV